MSTTQLGIRLDTDLVNRARSAAAQRSVSLAALVANALERDLADPAAVAMRQVSRAELLKLAAQITELAERLKGPSAEPVAEEPVALPVPDRAPVVGEPAGTVSSQPTTPRPAPGPEAVPAEAGSAPPLPAPPRIVRGDTYSAEVGPRPLVLTLWPVRTAQGVLAAMTDALNLSDAELERKLQKSGISRTSFDAELERKLIEWLGARGEGRPADPTEAMAALAAELRDALEPVAAEPAPPAGGGLPPD